MAIYRKLPTEVEAIQYIPNETDYLIQNLASRSTRNVYFTEEVPGRRTLIISTLEGDMIVNPGDYVILGVANELYPCKPDIFEETYELVE